MRKPILLIIGSLATSVSALAVASDLTIVSLGVLNQPALAKAYYAPFRDATATKIAAFTYDDLSFVRDMVAAGKPMWDVVEVAASDLVRGCEDGLFEKLDYSRIGSKGGFVAGSAGDCGIGMSVSSMVLAYDPAKVKDAPSSWADFWNLEKYPGPRALRRSARYTLEIALLADGVAPRDVYKMLATRAGVDRAFRKLDRIKADVRWWQAPSQPSVWLALGDVAMSSSEAFWIDAARAHGKELEIAWNGNLYEVNSWAIPKHAPHMADAYRFMAFASKAENQKVFAESIAYGPTNSGTVSLLDAALAGTLPAGDNLKAAFAIDESFWAQRGKALEERFEKWAPPIRRQQDEEDDEDYTP